MYSWRNFIDKYKRAWQLKPAELRGLLYTAIVLGFIFSFREWGSDSFNISMGLANYLRAIILVSLALLIHEASHRAIASLLGYRSEYKAWLLGLIAALVITFVFNGFIFFLAPGILIINQMKKHRFGTYPFGLLHRHLGWIAMSGAIAQMVFAIILKSVYFSFPNDWILKAAEICIWMALWNMCPIPPYNGSKTFFGSKLVYIFVVGSMIGAAALMTWVSGILAILGALVLGFLMLVVFFIFVERNQKVF